MHMCT